MWQFCQLQSCRQPDDAHVAFCMLQATPLEEQLEALSRAVESGKVRHIGLSNETPWGLMKALAAGAQ
jgi:aryl-alcohol dehydrogenase-like predicted oxidoreductase